MFFESLFDFMKKNIFWLSAILILIISTWFIFFEIRKLRKYLKNNSMQPNNVNEKSDLDNINTKDHKKEYSEEEIGRLILDILIEQKKTNDKLESWRNFGIIIIVMIIISIIESIIPS